MPDQSAGFIKAAADLAAYIWIFLLALLGGTASYINRLKTTETKFSLVELIGEWTISAFAGIVTALICAEFNYSFYVTAAMAGIAGHMGGRGVLVMEKIFVKRLGG